MNSLVDAARAAATARVQDRAAPLSRFTCWLAVLAATPTEALERRAVEDPVFAHVLQLVASLPVRTPHR